MTENNENGTKLLSSFADLNPYARGSMIEIAGQLAWLEKLGYRDIVRDFVIGAKEALQEIVTEAEATNTAYPALSLDGERREKTKTKNTNARKSSKN